MNARELHVREEGNFKPAGVYFCANCTFVARDKDTAEQCCRPWICECGEVCRPRGFLKCTACRGAEARAREDAQWDKATKIDAADYDGWVYDSNADEFHRDFGEFMDVWVDEREPGSAMPRLYACRSFGMSLDAHSILEDAVQDHHEDAFDNFVDDNVAELQAYLDGWAGIHGPTSYQPDHSRAIVWKDVEES